MTRAGFESVETWDFPYMEHPEHELAPLPKLFGIVGKIGDSTQRRKGAKTPRKDLGKKT